MKNRRFVRFSVFCLLGCILWIFVLRDYAVLAEELQEDTEKFVDQVNEYYEEVEDIGSVSFDEENLDDTGYVLSDTLQPLSSLRSSRSVIDSYDSSKSWLFDENLYKWNYPASNSYESYAFTYFAFNAGSDLDTMGNTLALVTDFYKFKKSQNAGFRLVCYPDIEYNGGIYNVLVVSTYQNTTTTMNAISNQLKNGFPELTNNIQWSGYENIDPSPTPDPTPTVIPSPNPEVVFEYMEQRPDLIVIIFALGVFIGIFAGTLVLRVLK